MHAVRVESPPTVHATAHERRAARAWLLSVARERRAAAHAKPRANWTAIALRPSTPEPMPAPVVPDRVAAAPAIAALVPPRYDAAYLDDPAPIPPSAARRLHEEDRVMLRVRVTADGRAGDVDVATSSGSERLDRAALDAARRWRIVPARRGDEAVAAEAFVPIVFSLDRA